MMTDCSQMTSLVGELLVRTVQRWLSVTCLMLVLGSILLDRQPHPPEHSNRTVLFSSLISPLSPCLTVDFLSAIRSKANAVLFLQFCIYISPRDSFKNTVHHSELASYWTDTLESIAIFCCCFLFSAVVYVLQFT